MSEARNVLNLDELFSDAQALEVKHDGKVYDLPRLKTLSPKKWQRFQELGKQALKLKNLKAENATGREVDEVEQMLDQMLRLLSKDLPLTPLTWWQRFLMFIRVKQFPHPLTLEEKTRIIMFYTTQDDSVKKVPVRGRRIGRKFSAN